MDTKLSRYKSVCCGIAVLFISNGELSAEPIRPRLSARDEIDRWVSRLPDGVQITEIDLAAFRADNPAPISASESKDGVGSTCERTAWQNLNRMSIVISKDGDTANHVSFLSTKNASWLIQCLTFSGAIKKSKNAPSNYELHGYKIPLVLSMLSEELVAISTPDWHKLIWAEGVTINAKRMCSSVLNERHLIQPSSDFGTLTSSCQAKTAAQAYVHADGWVSDADHAMAAYIAYPPPIGTPFCARAADFVYHAYATLYDARTSLDDCPATCWGAFLAFQPSGVAAVMQLLYNELVDGCSLSYLPLHNIIGGAILLNKIRSYRI